MTQVYHPEGNRTRDIPEEKGKPERGFAYQGDVTQQQREESLGQKAPKAAAVWGPL